VPPLLAWPQHRQVPSLWWPAGRIKGATKPPPGKIMITPRSDVDPTAAWAQVKAEVEA